MLEALQRRTNREYPLVDGTAPDRAPGGPDEIEVPGGPFTMGAEYEPWAYDNELDPHEVELPPFRIDRAPVTNGEFAEFVDARGYRSRKNWSDAGWAWREREDAHAPLYWEQGTYGWERFRFGRREPITPVGAGAARLLPRGAGVRAMGGQASPDRGRVGARGRLARA